MAVWFVCKAFSWEAQDVHGSTEDALRQKGIKFYEFYRNEDGDYVCDDKLPLAYNHRDGPQFTYCYEGSVVLRGPIKFVSMMYQKYPYVNFITHFKNGFSCTEYLSNYPKEWFLNSDGYFTTFGLLRNSKITKPCFIRPNSPFKSFTGFTLTPENFDVEMNSLEKISFLKPHDLILVSENKVIDSEFRYVICNKEVIGYSEYRWGGVLDIRRDTLPECLALAEVVAKHSKQIDDIYVVDIGMVEGKAKVIEFNSFLSSGLYAIDQSIMIDKIGEFIKNNDKLLYK